LVVQRLHPPGVLHRDLPLRRQDNPASPADDELDPQLLLQLPDVVAHRRLGQGQGLGRLGKILLLHHRQQRVQLSSQHSPSINFYYVLLKKNNLHLCQLHYIINHTNKQGVRVRPGPRSEEHTSELQSRSYPTLFRSLTAGWVRARALAALVKFCCSTTASSVFSFPPSIAPP